MGQKIMIPMDQTQNDHLKAYGIAYFSLKKNIPTFFMLDIIACVSPIGIFLGRLANFINGELVGKVTSVSWGIIFPVIDLSLIHI